MKPAPMISLGLSVLLGAGAVYFGRTYMGGSKADATQTAFATPAVTMSTVVVASATIEPGALIEPDMIRQIDWPLDAVPVGAFENVNEMAEKVYARGLIIEGEPILAGKIDETGASLTLAASIKPGKRAVSIVVNNDTGVAGFVLPGDRVDVNEFIPRKSAGGYRGDPDSVQASEDLVARSVLKNVNVLAIDQTFESGLEGAMPSNTVTLEVTPEQALLLGAASQRGAFGLSLIGRDEEAEVEAEKRKFPRRVATRVVKPAPRIVNVRVINGDDEKQITAPAAQKNVQPEEAQ